MSRPFYLFSGCLISTRLPFLEASSRFVLDRLGIAYEDLPGATCCVEPIGLRTMSTIKPLDVNTLVRSAKKTGCVVTAEEHSVRSGLGSTVACALSESYPVPLRRVGTPDCFGESGESSLLMSRYGLTAEHIIASAEEVIKRKRT